MTLHSIYVNQSIRLFNVYFEFWKFQKIKMVKSHWCCVDFVAFIAESNRFLVFHINPLSLSLSLMNMISIRSKVWQNHVKKSDNQQISHTHAKNNNNKSTIEFDQSNLFTKTEFWTFRSTFLINLDTEYRQNNQLIQTSSNLVWKRCIVPVVKQSFLFLWTYSF